MEKFEVDAQLGQNRVTMVLINDPIYDIDLQPKVPIAWRSTQSLQQQLSNA